MKWNRLLSGLLGFFGILVSSAVVAYDQPFVNLGFTSFLDGGPPAGPGFYFQNYFAYYTTHRFNDNKGNRLPFPQTDLHATADILQLIYLSKVKILGASLGVSAVEPVVLNARVNDGLPKATLKSTTGFGDLTIGPALQFDPVMRKNGKGPFYVQRLELDIIAPIGHYDSNFAIMPSSNFWSINPYWANTLWITEKWAISSRTHYLWNAKNKSPNVAFGPKVRSTQAGQAIFTNIATDYAITEKFHLGVNSYVFYQISKTRVDNIAVPGREEKVWAIGPGLLYGLTKNQFLFFNLYFEKGARNHTQGTSGVLRYVLHFG
jgi:anthranilate 1,2-dioxygenase (deaminating, decarboxylating) large subunit